MFDFFASKIGMSLLIVLFGASMIWIGVHDIERNYARVRFPKHISHDPMVRYLHGDVNLRDRSEQRRVESRVARYERERDWEGVKGFMKGLVP
jgi:hypothetical protein